MNVLIKIFLLSLVTFGLQRNLIVHNSSGVLIFQREKMYSKYRFTSTIFLILGIILAGSVTFFLHYLDKVLGDKFDVSKFITTIDIIVVGGYNMLVSIIFKKSKKFQNYLYENSFSYAYDIVFTLSVVFMLNYSYLDLTGVSFLMIIAYFYVSLLGVIISIFITSILFGFFIKSFNSDNVDDSMKNISARLLMMSIFAVIFYYLSKITFTITI